MSVIYEPVPKGFEGPVNLLRSLPHPPKKAYVRFINSTNAIITVKWIDFDGKLKNYCSLCKNEFFDCNTFVDHAWVFRDHKMHDPMCVDNKEVFWPSPKFEVAGDVIVPKRTTVVIHRPMLSLLTLAARAVRNSLKTVIEAFSLELPFHLQILVAKLILEYWDARPERRPNSPFPVPEDPENIILRRDFDDFQCNILYISYRLSIHAKKLLILARQRRGSGDTALNLIGVLEAIIRILGYDLGYNEIGTHTRKLAPIIWKQMIFLRVHLDTLQACCGTDSLERFHSYYDNLLHVVERRRKLMFPEHQKSLQKYHWEQLCLLTGRSVDGNTESIRDDSAYAIPELLPLDQRTEWEWIDLRRKQLKDHPNKELVMVFLGLTSNMLHTTNRLENIFQVLCILHYNLTGKQLTEELPSEDEDHPVLIKVA